MTSPHPAARYWRSYYSQTADDHLDLDRLIAEAVRLAEIERNATDALAQALGAAYDAGASVRRLADATGLSKSRVDRLHTTQLTIEDAIAEAASHEVRRRRTRPKEHASG